MTNGVEGGELWGTLLPSLNPLMPLSMGTNAGVLGFSIVVLIFLLFVIRLEMVLLLISIGCTGVGGI